MTNDPVFELFLQATRQGLNVSYSDVKNAILEEQAETQQQQAQNLAVINLIQAQNKEAQVEEWLSRAEWRRSNPNQPRERYKIGDVRRVVDQALICGDITDEQYNRFIGIFEYPYERTEKQEIEIQAMGRIMSRVGLL